MAAQIISLAQRLRPPPSRDWSSQEVAEFYRVESALLQAGLALESERGLSDEGDPWFVFCRQDTGEVFIHFARVDGEYVVDGAAFPFAARGRDFGMLVRDLIGRHPLAATRRPQSNVFLHPAALLIALVGAAFFQSGHAKAAEAHDGHAAAPAKAEARRGLTLTNGPAPAAGLGEGARVVPLDPSEVAAILTGVAIGIREASAAAAPQGGALPTAPLSEAALGLPGLDLAHVRGTDSLSRLSAADTRAALTVMAAFADMAVTRPVAVAVAAAPVSEGEMTSFAAAPLAPAAAPEAAPGELSFAVAPVEAPAPRPMLLVSLSAGALPEIAAVALVTADGALAHVDGARIMRVELLPSLLADLISRGEIIDVAARPTNLPAVAPPPPTAPSGHGEVTSPATPAHDGASGGGAPPPVVAPGHEATDTGAPAPSTPAPPVTLPTSHDARIDAAILDFVNKVAKVQIVVTDHEVVFYDPAILGVLDFLEKLDSITWKLEDGSTVSLVGTAHDLHAYHGIG